MLAALFIFYMLYKLTSGHDQYLLQKLSQKIAVADNELPGFVNGAQVIPYRGSVFSWCITCRFYNLIGLSYRCDNRWFIGGIFASKIHTATIRLIIRLLCLF